MLIIKIIFLIIPSYFIGNINFARIISKKNNVDVTKKGSGNPGTMNMLRNYGTRLGGLTFILDISKGALPSVIGFFLLGGYNDFNLAYLGLYIAGFSVVLGHIYPVIYNFKGGKGVASSLGVFLVANPIITLIVFVVAMVYLWFFEYGSVASFIMIISITTIEAIRLTNFNSLAIIFLVLMSILAIFAHRKNISRLIRGVENKLKLKNIFKKNK